MKNPLDNCKFATTRRSKRFSVTVNSTLAVCLTFALLGCKPKMREGEVFVLLKSDEVKPLADIEVVGFDANFGARFSEWKRKWSEELSERKALIRKSPEWSRQFEEANRRIEEALSQKNSVEAQVKSNQIARLRVLQAEQHSLSNRMAQMRTKMLDGEAIGAFQQVEDRAQIVQQDMDLLLNRSLSVEIAGLRRVNLERVNELMRTKDGLTTLAEAEAHEELLQAFSAFIASKAVHTTRTGSRGDFQMPANVVFVFAGAIRPNTGETPCWLVRIDPQQKSIRLSNSNLATKENSDSTWMLKHTP